MTDVRDDSTIDSDLDCDALERIGGRVGRIVERLRRELAAMGDSDLHRDWGEWIEQFEAIRRQAARKPEVSICMVGGTGCGKSTLINAILGVRLLPVGSAGACTSAVAEIVHEPGDRFVVDIEFVNLASWRSEMTQLFAEATPDDEAPQDMLDAPLPLDELARPARRKLLAIYGEEALGATDPSQLAEPPPIARCFAEGTRRLTETDPKLLAKDLKDYLDSHGPYWPIVKRIRIRGPFPALGEGIRLVDLPGLNDPNEAREAVTKAYLRECDFVWIVFAVSRVLTRDVFDFLQSDDFLRRILMDGRAQDLTFVATRIDDIDDTAVEDGAEEDEAWVRAIHDRNEKVRTVLDDQLADLARRLAESAGENPAKARELGGFLQQCPVFMTSSREFLRLVGLAKTKGEVFSEAAQTGIPDVRRHLRDRNRIDSLAVELGKRSDDLLLEMRESLRTRRLVLEAQIQDRGFRVKEVNEAVDSARSFLDGRLPEERTRFHGALERVSAVFEERLNSAQDRANREIADLIRNWRKYHWATLRATVRRGGRHVGSTGTHDFPADIAKPLLDSISFAWDQFFREVGTSLDEARRGLLDCAREHMNRLPFGFFRAPQPSSAVLAPWVYIPGNDRAPANAKSSELSPWEDVRETDRVLMQRLGAVKDEMDRRLTADRRGLHERVAKEIAQIMGPAFEAAAKEHGAGMKDRMIEILRVHALRVSDQMYLDARARLLEGLRELSAYLEDRFDELVDTTSKQASMKENAIRTTKDNTLDVGELRAMLVALAPHVRLLEELAPARP